ncbi:MAG: GntR family transcriptional regulator [Tenericutes bacterium]|nr:GntR family transcriptional regulator [Mycoplasmatota bacterium]
MNLIITNSSDVPIYQQIKNQIINSIGNNELKANDMLPSIRNLAKDLRISILTVKKAYDELEQEAYIRTVQGKGTFVTPRNNELIREKQLSIIEGHIEDIVNIAKVSNINKSEIIDIFNYIYEEE